MTAWFIVKREEAEGINPYYPRYGKYYSVNKPFIHAKSRQVTCFRERWHAYDPYLISEGLFGAGMISSFLKLVHISSINPHLGPLQVRKQQLRQMSTVLNITAAMQISLGRMTMDITKWLVLYVLVLFAFGCGMNQLLW